MSKYKVLLGVSGSIAAYKAAELVRLMKKSNWSVHVVMTEAATKFVSSLTFQTLSQNPVAVRMFDDVTSWTPEHIALAEDLDTFVVAPCTANVIAKLANGLADDFLSTVALAVTAPTIIAPAMNEKMWQHQATRTNVNVLKDRGVVFIEPDSGDLACGCKGEGRLADPSLILSETEKIMR